MHRPPADPDPQFPLSPFLGSPGRAPEFSDPLTSATHKSWCKDPRHGHGTQARLRGEDTAEQPKKPETSITIEFVFYEPASSAPYSTSMSTKYLFISNHVVPSVID